MNILIADDEHAVRKNFELSIRRLGHIPIICPTLSKTTAAINDASRQIDIVFLDNHFPNEDYGIDRIRQFCQIQPDMDVIVTTERPVDPGLVKEILDLGVGFFKKNTVDPDLLDAEITQRVNSRISKRETIRQKILALQKDSENGGEGVRRFFRFFKSRKKLIIDSIEPTGEKLIVPNFERFETIHYGQNIEIKEEYEVECSAEYKAATAMEFGLGLHESTAFFASKVGGEIKQRLRTDFGYNEKRTLKSSFKKGQKLSLTPTDERNGVRKREFYRGIEHQVYRVAIRTSCNKCGLVETILVRIFIPISFVEVTVSFDMTGTIIPDEDGRQGYRQLRT